MAQKLRGFFLTIAEQNRTIAQTTTPQCSLEAQMISRLDLGPENESNAFSYRESPLRLSQFRSFLSGWQAARVGLNGRDSCTRDRTGSQKI
jgi:hypothetical protein